MHMIIATSDTHSHASTHNPNKVLLKTSNIPKAVRRSGHFGHSRYGRYGEYDGADVASAVVIVGTASNFMWGKGYGGSTTGVRMNVCE